MTVREPTNADASTASSPEPPLTVLRPESSAIVPSVRLLVPSPVVKLSTPEMFVNAASEIV